MGWGAGPRHIWDSGMSQSLGKPRVSCSKENSKSRHDPNTTRLGLSVFPVPGRNSTQDLVAWRHLLGSSAKSELVSA